MQNLLDETMAEKELLDGEVNEELAEELAWFALPQEVRERNHQEMIDDLRKSGASEEFIQEQEIGNRYLWDDVLPLGCKACGECCYGEEGRLLHPYDVFRIAKELNISTNEVLISYCGDSDDDGKMHSECRLKIDKDSGACIFLRDGKCSIHEVKPGVCKAYPLGKAIDSSGLLPNTFSRYQDCSQTPPLKEQTIREWMGPSESGEGDLADNAYVELLCMLSSFDIDELPPSIKGVLDATVTTLKFCNYNIAGEFLPQFRRRVDAIEEVLVSYGIFEHDEE